MPTSNTKMTKRSKQLRKVRKNSRTRKATKNHVCVCKTCGKHMDMKGGRENTTLNSGTIRGVNNIGKTVNNPLYNNNSNNFGFVNFEQKMELKNLYNELKKKNNEVDNLKLPANINKVKLKQDSEAILERINNLLDKEIIVLKSNISEAYKLVTDTKQILKNFKETPTEVNENIRRTNKSTSMLF